MHQQTMQFGAPATPPSPHPYNPGQNQARLPWIFIMAGGATAVLAFALLFFVATIDGIDHEVWFFFGSLTINEGLMDTCCVLAAAGCVVAGVGYVQLKKTCAPVASQLHKLSIYSFIQAGLIFLIMIFFIPLVDKMSFYNMTWGVYLFFITSLATAFGLSQLLVKKEWTQMVMTMNWTDNFTRFLKLGYTLAFWSITPAAALMLIFSISLASDLYDGFATFVSGISMLAYWVALAGGVFWAMAQVKLGLRIGNILPANNQIGQQPYQQDHSQTVMFPQQNQQQQQYQQQQQQFQQQQQQYQQQQYQQYQQPFQQQQQPQPNQSQQEYNERLRQQQYEEYRRQQQERMRQMGDSSPETMPYKK